MKNFILLSLLALAFYSSHARAEFTGNLNGKTFYEVLGVDPGASQPEILRASRKGFLMFHPGQNGGEGTTRESVFIVSVRTLLEDPESRKLYDAYLRFCAKQGIETGLAEQQLKLFSKFLTKYESKTLEQKREIFGAWVARNPVPEKEAPMRAISDLASQRKPEAPVVAAAPPDGDLVELKVAAPEAAKPVPSTVAARDPKNTKAHVADPCGPNWRSFVMLTLVAAPLLVLPGDSNHLQNGDGQPARSTATPTVPEVTKPADPVKVAPVTPVDPAQRGQSFRDKLKQKK